MEILLKFMCLKNHLTIVFICLLFFFPTTVVAQTSFSSNSFITKVGNAKEEDRPKTQSSNALLQAALDLFQAYQGCGGGSTVESYLAGRLVSYARKPCLVSALQSKYTSNISAFSTRYGDKFGLGAIPGNCVECMGFVALSLTLATNYDKALPFGAPSAINLRSLIEDGPLKLRSVVKTDIQPGDIGTTVIDTNNTNIGHILVVKETPSKKTTFIGIESAYPTPCTVNDKQSHPSESYNFFRLNNP